MFFLETKLILFTQLVVEPNFYNLFLIEPFGLPQVENLRLLYQTLFHQS